MTVDEDVVPSVDRPRVRRYRRHAEGARSRLHARAVARDQWSLATGIHLRGSIGSRNPSSVGSWNSSIGGLVAGYLIPRAAPIGTDDENSNRRPAPQGI